MKRKLAVFMIGTMAIALLVGGCGSDETAQSTGSAADASETGSADAEEVVYDAATLLSATEYDIADYVTLMEDYMSMTVEITGDYDVQTFVEENVLCYAVSVESDRTTVEEGDTVNIDYVGTLDGEAFDGGTAEGYDLTIGSGTFIDGFEDGLIGVELGSTVDLDLTFPDSYSNEDLAGQDVVFTVTVNSIYEDIYITYDEMTDEYIASIFSDYYTTVDEMLADVESYIESQKLSDIQTEVLEILIANSTVTLPDSMVDERVADTIASIQSYADAYGMEYEDYVLTYYSSYADTVEEFEAYVLETIEGSLMEEFILEAIVYDQQISITGSTFDSFVSVRVSYYGYDSNEDFYDTYGGEEYVRLACAESQALTLVSESVTAVVVSE